MTFCTRKLHTLFEGNNKFTREKNILRINRTCKHEKVVFYNADYKGLELNYKRSVQAY